MALSSSSSLHDTETLISCPYDKTHQIRQARMPYHLVKCRKQHPEIQLERCIFNPTHLFKKDEMKEHQQNCPDSSRLEEYTRIFNDTQIVDLERIKKDTVEPAVCKESRNDEDWEDLVGTKSYNPQRATKDKRIIKTVRGKTKSERKEFYKEEYMRRMKMPELPQKRPIMSLYKLDWSQRDPRSVTPINRPENRY